MQTARKPERTRCQETCHSAASSLKLPAAGGPNYALQKAPQVRHIPGRQLHVLVPARREVGLRGPARQGVQQAAGLHVNHAVARSLEDTQ